MNLPTGSAWESWVTTQTGDGVVSISGNVATMSSGISTGTAKLERRFHTRPGEVYTMTLVARRITGSAGTSGASWVDWPAVTGIKTRNEINSPEFREYKVRYAIPLTSDADSYISLGVGVYTALGGQIEVVGPPTVAVEDTPFGSLRTVAHGLVYWDGAAISLNSAFSESGISALSYDSGTKRIKLTIPSVNTAVATRPLFFVQRTPDGTATSLQLVPVVGSYDATTGEVFIAFINPATGVAVDITGATYELYFFFKAEM